MLKEFGLGTGQVKVFVYEPTGMHDLHASSILAKINAPHLETQFGNMYHLMRIQFGEFFSIVDHFEGLDFPVVLATDSEGKITQAFSDWLSLPLRQIDGWRTIHGRAQTTYNAAALLPEGQAAAASDPLAESGG